jgi:DNA repair protein RadA/Sms
MALKTKYCCQECGHVSIQLLGKCPSCGKWNSFVEEVEEGSKAPGARGPANTDATLDAIVRDHRKQKKTGNKVERLSEVVGASAVRWSTGIGELDRVLGGGAVEGSFLLIGGEPGIGKSTLLLQALESLGKSKKVLYVTGEESAEQVKLRASRLNLKGDKISIATETCLEKIFSIVETERPDVVAIDSIQTMFTEALTSAPGSVSQVREVGARFMHLAKGAGILVILVGHVTKEGTIAGPRVLEHMVDTVLYFESGAGHAYRILRGVKNRFGSTNEIGVFEMTELGLQEVKNPSALFLAERPKGAPGSVAVSCVEGTRPILVELQALVSKSFLPSPRRTVLGVESNRAAILLAVMEKRMEMGLFDRDVFINVVGGLKLEETSVDLGVIAAVASSYFNRPVDNGTLFLGEVGLTGELRGVSRVDDRLKEALNMGFKRCFLPRINFETLKSKQQGMECIPLSTVRELKEYLFV